MKRWMVAVAMLAASGCDSVESAAPHALYDAAALDTAAEGASDAAGAPADRADTLAVEAAPDAADAPEAARDAAPDADAAEAPPTQEEMCRSVCQTGKLCTDWDVGTSSCWTFDRSALHTDVPTPFECRFMTADDGQTRCLPTPGVTPVGFGTPTCKLHPLTSNPEPTSPYATVPNADGTLTVHKATTFTLGALWYEKETAASGNCLTRTASAWTYTTSNRAQEMLAETWPASMFVAYP